MKILIICPMLPYPIKAGGDQAVFNMITELQHKHEIHFLYSGPKAEEENILKGDLWRKVRLYPFKQVKTVSFYLSRIALLIKEKFMFKESNIEPLISSSQFITPDFLRFVDDCIKKINPDIIQTEFYNYVDLLHTFPKDVKKIFIQHEIRYIINQQKIGNSEDIVANFTYNKLRREEIDAMNGYDGVITLTEVDRNKLQEDGVTTKIFTSPAGIAPPTTRNKSNFKNKLIFVGGSAHSPNVDGLEWFLDNIWSDVKSQHKELTLDIVGNWNDKLKDKITSKHKGVNFLGFVPSLEECYDGAIAIVPILRGSGMRMKIIDAVNMGSPFISTSVGAEGLMYKDGIDCYIADEPDQFTSKLLNMIDSKEIRNKFYVNSEITRDKHYSIEALVEKRSQIYSELALNIL